MTRKALIGVTLDAEPPGGYSRYHWYALRTNYMEAIAAAGGLPVALPHHAAQADDYLEQMDALVVTGGAFDVDPALYTVEERHATVSLEGGAHQRGAGAACGGGGFGAADAGAGDLRRSAAAGGGPGWHIGAAHSGQCCGMPGA